MVLLEGMALGWLLIVIGAILLLVEVHSPGFFATVPATVTDHPRYPAPCWELISSIPAGALLIGVVAALCAAGVTVWMYSRITPEGSPTTLSRDSLIGKEGQVIADVDATTIKGKVRIGTTDWSAHSNGALIPKGKTVRVVDSEGVHIVVEEV